MVITSPIHNAASVWTHRQNKTTPPVEAMVMPEWRLLSLAKGQRAPMCILQSLKPVPFFFNAPLMFYKTLIRTVSELSPWALTL